MSSLKPCPLCGSMRIAGVTISNNSRMFREYVCCEDCGASTATYEVEQEAVDAWNTRYKRTCKMPMYHGEDADDDLPAYYRNFKCDACGEIHNRYKHDYYKFCPNCGSEVVDA